MSNTEIVPAPARLAAKRAFVRTTAQAYAGAIPAGGVSAAALINLVDNPDPLVIGGVTAAWIASPLLAGLASALTFIARGIPEDYVTAVDDAT